jgi:hypothetical protein
MTHASNAFATKGKARETSLTAVINRKDGSKQNLGTIAYWHRNPLKRFLFRLKGLFR